MRIARIIEGNLYVTSSGETVRCSAPFACRGAKSGMCVFMWDLDGRKRAMTKDGTLRPASMREQRDFWKSAFERACNE
jgi:hypothetical protein